MIFKLMESIVVTIQIAIALLYVGYLISRYSMPTVTICSRIFVYLTWLLSFIIVVILPYDIYHSLQEDYAMSIVWKSIYYAIFFLTWLFLPILQEYQTAGEFTVKAKLKTAIINNLIIYGVFIIIGVLFFIYLFIKGQLDLEKLMPILMAASNAFGMFLVVIFLSYGLVTIPKQMWRQKKYQIKLKQKQFTATFLFKKKQNLLQELQLKYKQVLWQKSKTGETIEINYILNLVPEVYRLAWGRNVPDLGEIDVIKVHKEIKEMLLEFCRIESRWENLIDDAFMIEDILANMQSANRRIESTLYSISKYECINLMKWLWHCRIKLYLIPSIALLFSLFAVAIIIAQLSVFVPAISFLNPFSHLFQIQTFLALDCSLIFVMAYIVFCVYYALFKLKFSSYYGLYWNKQTDASSLIFFAINCSRVSTPLCYNFLQIINSKNTSFSKVMGVADMVPVFGQTFYYIFPSLLIILILINVFDIYSKMAKLFGLERFVFENGFNHENIDEGRKLLQKARTQIQNQILNSNSKDLREYRSYKSQTGIKQMQEQINKESSSSDKIAIKGTYFNQFKNMENFNKIMSM